MSRAALTVNRATVLRWFLVQITAVLLLSFVLLLFKGPAFAVSLLIGGSISILPNAVFARWWFSYFKANSANRMVMKFYVGEVFKLTLTVILFILIFKFLRIDILAALLGYAIAQFVFWIGPLFSLRLSK